ncbi:MAG: MBL fold metallo-hydrolase [Polyangiaceae bacterium]
MRSLIASVFVASSILMTACVGPGTEGPDTAGETSQQEGSVGVFTSGPEGFDTHSFYHDTGKEVVVFDAQFTPDLAKKLAAEIQAKTSSPITYVVVTHPNPDKFNGASEFQKMGAKVVASKATAAAMPGVHAYKKYYFVHIAKMFTEESYPAEVKVDVTFEGDYELPLAAGKVELHELGGAGVSSTQTVAWVPAQKALFVGDLVHHGAHAWLEGGIVEGKATPDLGAWKKTLGELLDYEGATVFGGRGESAKVEVAVEEQIGYLTGMEKLVGEYVAGLGASAKEELSGEAASGHHKKMAELAASKYPERALPYLVEYGVYGLANQIAGL